MHFVGRQETETVRYNNINQHPSQYVAYCVTLLGRCFVYHYYALSGYTSYQMNESITQLFFVELAVNYIMFSIDEKLWGGYYLLMQCHRADSDQGLLYFHNDAFTETKMSPFDEMATFRFSDGMGTISALLASNHRSHLNSPYKGPEMRCFMLSFFVKLNKLFKKQSNCQ